MSIGTNIKSKRIMCGFTLEDLAKKIGTSKQTIQRYEAGIISNIPSDKIEALAQALHTTPAYLMGWEEDALPQFDNIFQLETKRFPLLGEIACGEPIYAEEQFDAYVEAGATIQADFCLKTKGDSMIGARIYDGDIVFIRKQPMVEDGEIAAVIIENEATLKRVYYDKEHGVLQLFAENPQYKTLRYVGDDLNRIRILGRAVAFQSDIK